MASGRFNNNYFVKMKSLCGNGLEDRENSGRHWCTFHQFHYSNMKSLRIVLFVRRQGLFFIHTYQISKIPMSE